MASLPSRTTASFAAIAPVPSLDPLDDEFDQLVGGAGIFNGGTIGTKLLTKASDASDPVYEFDQVGTGPIIECKQNGTLKVAVLNSGKIDSSVATGTAPIEVDSTTMCPNLNADMVDGQHYSDIQAFVNAKQIRWAANWFIADPSTFPLNSFNLAQKVFIPSGNFTATAIGAICNTGTASGSFSIEVRKHPFANQAAQTTLGTITFDPGTIAVGATVDIVDHTFTDTDFLYLVLTARSSPAHRDVSIFVAGYQTPLS